MGVGDDYMDTHGCTYPGDYFHPKYMDDPNWDKYEAEIFECVELGMTPRHAFRAAGLQYQMYHDWVRRFPGEIEQGVRDSPFVKFMVKLSKKSEVLHKALLKKGNEIALDGDGNAKMIQYYLDTRYKYSKKKEVEVGTADDTTFNINIVESKPRED